MERFNIAFGGMMTNFKIILNKFQNNVVYDLTKIKEKTIISYETTFVK